MNGILKSIAVVAIVSFFLSACGGESSGESTGSMSSGGVANLSQLSDAAKRGYALYNSAEQACATCHGAQGQGTPSAAPIPINSVATCVNCGDLAMLTGYNTIAMPKAPTYSPGACVGACASDVSSFIIEGFIQGLLTYDNGGNNNPPPATPAINVNPTTGLTTTEAGGTASFTVTLNTLPTDNVDITLLSDDPSEGDVNPATLTFTTANWNQPQTVMVTGADDQLLDGNVGYNITTTAASNDVDYAAINPDDVAVTNTDNEVPPPGVVTVTPTAGLVTTEDAGTATFTIVLGTQPTDNVTIGLSSNNAAEGTVTDPVGATVAFTSANYNVPQTVTVTGVDDAAAPAVDGNIAYSIVTAAAISNDPSYSGLAVSDVSVTNNDNDVQPVISAFTADPVSNAGAPIPYNGMVTLNWTSDGDACTAGGATANNQWTGALATPTGMLTLTNLTTAGVNTFAITCTKGGISSDVATVDVTVMAQPGAPVINTFAADPAMLTAVGPTTITWATTDATSCSATSNPANATWDNVNKGIQGTQQIPNLGATTTFSLSCTNNGGLVTLADTIVTVVLPNPTVSLTASPAVVSEGGTTKLTWTVTDMQSCTAVDNGGWTGAKGILASQEEDVAGLFAATTFTINCVGLDNQQYASSASITIDPTSTGEYLYNNATFGGVQTCADSLCHGTPAAPGLTSGVFYPIFDKAALCAKYGIVANPTATASIISKTADTMPPGIDANQQFLALNCGADCATKITNYMFLNFYGGNTTDCEGGVLPLAIP